MRLILQYLRRYWIFALAAPALMFLEVAMDLVLPAVMAEIVDSGVPQQDLSKVLLLGLTMVGATLLSFVGGAGCAVFATYASTGLGADLRRDLFGKVLGLSSKSIDRLETGHLITRLTQDVAQVEEITQMLMRVMVRAPLQIVGSLGMALMLSPSLSLLFVAFIPLLLLVVFVTTRRAYPFFVRVQAKMDALNTCLQENLVGKRLVKAFGRESHEQQKFADINGQLSEATTKASRMVAGMNPIMQVLMNGAIVAALWYGAKLVDSNVLKVGGLIAFLTYLRQLLFSLMMFSDVIIRFSRAQASTRRIEELLVTVNADEEMARGDHCAELRGDIEFRSVCFSYTHLGEPVLNAISFRILPGQTVAFIGSTGSGKSTIAKLIPRFYEVDEGDILIDGVSIKSWNPEALRRQIAYVPQRTLLFSGTIEDNILYPFPQEKRPELRALMEDVAEVANIAPFIQQQALGYLTDVNQRGVNLSGGQKQRLAIARALAKDAPLIIFDDATSAVDAATEHHIRQALKDKQAGKTVLMIAQRITTVMEADLIVVMDDGQISAQGTHPELMKNSPLYREIFDSQLDAKPIDARPTDTRAIDKKSVDTDQQECGV